MVWVCGFETNGQIAIFFYFLVSSLSNKSIRHALGSPKSGGGFVLLMQFKICGKNCKKKFLDFLHLCSGLVHIVGRWSRVWKIVICLCIFLLIGSFLVVYCLVIYLEYACEIFWEASLLVIQRDLAVLLCIGYNFLFRFRFLAEMLVIFCVLVFYLFSTKNFLILLFFKFFKYLVLDEILGIKCYLLLASVNYLLVISHFL